MDPTVLRLPSWALKARSWVVSAIGLVQTVARLDADVAALKTVLARLPPRPMTRFTGVLWAKVEVVSHLQPHARWEPCCPVCMAAGREIVLMAILPDENDYEQHLVRLDCPHPEHTPVKCSWILNEHEYYQAVERLDEPLDQQALAA